MIFLSHCASHAYAYASYFAALHPGHPDLAAFPILKQDLPLPNSHFHSFYIPIISKLDKMSQLNA